MLTSAQSGNGILPAIILGALVACQIANCDPLTQSAGAQKLLKFGDLPISFEPNRGQASPDVYFMSRGMQYSLSLLESGAQLDVSSPDRKSTRSLNLTFVNANAVSSTPGHTQGIDELGFKSHYFIGNDQRKWVKDVPNFAKVRYNQVWKGVDVVFYGNEDRLEYDLVVAPGANPKNAAVAFPGASLLVNKNGDLVLHGVQGDFLQQKPIVYQMVNNRRETIAGRYVVAGERVSFDIGNYDHSRELVIDPVIGYSVGRIDNNYNVGTGAAVDAAGNSLLAGTTIAVDVCGTNCAKQKTGWVARLDPVGNIRVKFTFAAPDGPVVVNGLAADSKGSAYVTGNTGGLGFPVTVSPFQAASGGGTDAYVIRFDFTPAGGAVLAYGSYLGGNSIDSGNAIAVDNSGHAYVAGSTASVNFPRNSGITPTGTTFDAFVTEFDTNAGGSASVLYSWVGGGSGNEAAQGIAVDAGGNAYVGGNTTSQNFLPASSAGYNMSKTNANADGFLLRLTPTANAVGYFTYFPFGPINAVAAEPTGNAYVTGQTNGPIPTNSTNQGFQLSPQGGIDAFVARFNTAATGVSSLVYSSYLGGAGNDNGAGIVTDGSGTAFVSGTTGSANFPVAGALQPFGGGATDAFLSILNTNLSGTSSLAYGTFLGGSGDDSAGAIALTPYKNPVIVGATSSANIGNPPDGGIDTRAFATKILFEEAPFGVVDTPANGATGQAGAINFTGWALSRLTVTNIALCRESLPGEPGINGLLYLGNAVLTPGARPDVAAAHPGYPNNNWGWGAQILTNTLPGVNGQPLGNGTYKLHAIAADPEGTASVHDSRDCSCVQRFCTDLGVATMTVNNAGSARPFGTIDTPGQGQVISGTDFVNFGWVVTPQPNIIPIDGSTITVFIDNVAVGHPVYNQFRSDIATLFPGLKNSNGAIGYFHIDTTKLSNGIHNIAWGVTDSASNAQGIGSRAFFVQN